MPYLPTKTQLELPIVIRGCSKDGMQKKRLLLSEACNVDMRGYDHKRKMPKHHAKSVSTLVGEVSAESKAILFLFTLWGLLTARDQFCSVEVELRQFAPKVALFRLHRLLLRPM